jgi:hypothetical protein
MFSDEVDEIWHEMIMFTRDYQNFCQAFVGQMIHHSPNEDKTPNPHGRAWFDWIYSNLFHISNSSLTVYNTFSQHILNDIQIRNLETKSIEEVKTLYFQKADSENISIIHRLIMNMKQEIAEARKNNSGSHPLVLSSQSPSRDSSMSKSKCKSDSCKSCSSSSCDSESSCDSKS